MQPLPWSDPSLRFASAPVFDNEQAAEELQTTSAAGNANSTDNDPIEAQQEAEVRAADVQLNGELHVDISMLCRLFEL